MAKQGQYVQVVWAYGLGNVNQILRVSLDSTAMPVSRVDFVNANVTVQPVGVATHTAYIVHWNQADLLVPRNDGKVQLNDGFLHLPILTATWETSNMFAWTHNINEATQNIDFWLTYEDGSPVLLTAPDARFSVTLLLYLTQASANP
jgi:hypothetical protein